MIEREAEAQDTEEALRKKEMEAGERRKQSYDLVAESIRRELAERKVLSILSPNQSHVFVPGRRKKRFLMLTRLMG